MREPRENRPDLRSLSTRDDSKHGLRLWPEIGVRRTNPNFEFRIRGSWCLTPISDVRYYSFMKARALLAFIGMTS